MVEHRVRQGDFFRAVAVSSLAIDVSVKILIELDSGRLREYGGTLVTPSNRTGSSITMGNIEGNGHVVRGSMSVLVGTPQRGEVFLLLETRDRNGITVDMLINDYIYGNHIPSFPNVIGPGPGDGAGFIKPRVVADDIAPVAIQETFAAQNTLRRIDGFIWYYHCSSDVASRTLRAFVRDLGIGLPTGMTSGLNTTPTFYPSAGALTLTANEEGMIYVNATSGKSFAVSIDNGARTVEDITTDPDPFPYWANKADVGEILFQVDAAEAADRHSIYIIQEEWID